MGRRLLAAERFAGGLVLAELAVRACRVAWVEGIFVIPGSDNFGGFPEPLKRSIEIFRVEDTASAHVVFRRSKVVMVHSNLGGSGGEPGRDGIELLF